MYKTRVTDAELVEPLALRVDVHLSHVRVLQHVTMQRSLTQSSFKAVRLTHARRPAGPQIFPSRMSAERDFGIPEFISVSVNY